MRPGPKKSSSCRRTKHYGIVGACRTRALCERQTIDRWSPAAQNDQRGTGDGNSGKENRTEKVTRPQTKLDAITNARCTRSQTGRSVFTENTARHDTTNTLDTLAHFYKSTRTTHTHTVAAAARWPGGVCIHRARYSVYAGNHGIFAPRVGRGHTRRLTTARRPTVVIYL